MRELGFDDVKLNGPTSALSGGWRMKLALARCILIQPDIMLLDEPTNHLDHATVDWFINRLQNETHATVLVVSHDTGFLDAICTDIIHVSRFLFFICGGWGGLGGIFPPLPILSGHFQGVIRPLLQPSRSLFARMVS